ncbi:MAG: ABC transporter substrate-binding protein [Candidatus Methanosuratus sp.]|nr:ABC transporter substrate-binding protein [Candidatus Methanosuratincola sp.]
MGDVMSMDPYSYRESFSISFLQHIYEPLVRYNRDLKKEPCLATSWKILEPKVWRFTLRRGVKFHNGNPLNAEDVVASIKRAIHPNSPFKGHLPAVEDVRKVDDYTVDIHLKESYPLLLNELTYVGIMDKEWMTENKCLEPSNPSKGEKSYASTNTNGTGPFLLESRQPDAKTILVANPSWWDKPQHNLIRMVFTPIKSDATRVAALLSGEIDFMFPVPLQDIDRINRTAGFKVMQGYDLRTILLMFNQAPNELHHSNIKGKNPLRDIRVRKALFQAVDMETIQKRIMRGRSRIAGQFAAPEIPGYDPLLNERLPYDPVASKRLLSEAGYPEGFEVALDCPNDRYVNDDEICQAVSSMWAKVGVKAKLSAQTKTIHFKKVETGQCDIWLLGYATLPLFDSYGWLSQVLSSPRKNRGNWNPGGYVNLKVEELVDKISVELDEPRRLKMISEAFKLAKDDVPLIPLHQQPLCWAVRSGINVTLGADELPRLWYATID